MSQQQSHYSMVIEWSPVDQLYVVSFPEWGAAGVRGHVHGATYEDAVRAGKEHLAFLVESQQAEGLPLPEPHVYASAT